MHTSQPVGALSRIGQRTGGTTLLRAAAPNCRELLAQLKRFFRERAQRGGGLYLPLVRVDRGE